MTSLSLAFIWFQNVSRVPDGYKRMCSLMLDLVQELDDAEKAKKVFQTADVQNALNKLVELVIRAARELQKYYQSTASKWTNAPCRIVADGI